MVKYSPELTEKICIGLMEGKSLTKICKMDEMPAYRTVVDWLLKYPEFKEKYEFARNVQYEKMSDDILDIADDREFDVDPETGKEIWESINRSRLRIDTRKWILAHVLPKKFGQKVVNEVTGPNGAALNAVPTEQEKFEMARLIAFKLTKATKEAA